MAVPKKKTSSSKRNMRRSHDKIKPINVFFNKNTENDSVETNEEKGDVKTDEAVIENKDSK